MLPKYQNYHKILIKHTLEDILFICRQVYGGNTIINIVAPAGVCRYKSIDEDVRDLISAWNAVNDEPREATLGHDENNSTVSSCQATVNLLTAPHESS